MLTFDPPDLESQLKKALSGFAGASGLDPSDLQGDFFDTASEDYDPAEFQDQIVTPETECLVSLPRVSQDFGITYRELIDLLVEAQSARLEENTVAWSRKRSLIRVTTEYFETASLVDRHFHHHRGAGSPRIFKHAEIIDGQEIHCCLTRGFTLFGILVTSKGDYEKYFPPITDEEYFIEVRFPDGTPEPMVRNVMEAYIFELSTSHHIHLTKSPRPTLDHESWRDMEHAEDEAMPDPLPLRPLLLGAGMSGMIELFNKAKSVVSPDVAVLYYSKVIEYASPTILRQKLTTTIQNKLSSPRAMNPDAQFVLELDRLFQENRTYRKDKESVALTIEQCCDADELRKAAPPFLRRLAAISDTSTKQDKDVAIREFAFTLSATRNAIAHAKANYEPTGEECPEAQLFQFVACLEIVAEQVIRWFARCPEHQRVL